MASVALTSARNAHSRDPSLSSYLGMRETSPVLKHGEPTWIAPRKNAYQENLGRKKNRFGEISVFGAERYFSSLIDESAAMPVDKTDEKVETRRTSPSNFSRTSCSSKSAFLPITQSRGDKPSGKSFLAKLRCNWHCFNKKSVETEENVLDKTCIKRKKNIGIHENVETKLSNESKNCRVDPVQTKGASLAFWTKEQTACNKLKKGSYDMDSEDCFSLNIPNPDVGDLPLETKIEEVEEANARESLERHESPGINKETPSTLEKHLAMLNSDANPRIGTISPLIKSEATSDTDSDSTSDLFELKGISDSEHPCFWRQPYDGMSGCMSPSSGYEPSEASINWSVATASAANFSLATDNEEPIPKETVNISNSVKPTENTANRKSAAKKGISKAKHCPGILSDCKSHVAVKTAGTRKLSNKKRSTGI